MRDERTIAINEQFVIDIPQDNRLATMTMRIIETTLSSYGDCIMSGMVDVQHLLGITQNGTRKEHVLRVDNAQGRHTGNLIIDVATDCSKGSLVHQNTEKDHQGISIKEPNYQCF